jgi:hypothetical protein
MRFYPLCPRQGKMLLAGYYCLVFMGFAQI